MAFLNRGMKREEGGEIFNFKKDAALDDSCFILFFLQFFVCMAHIFGPMIRHFRIG